MEPPKDSWQLSVTKPLSSIALWVFTFALSLTLGITVSICTNNWEWFGRSGSIATISGLLLIMRPLFRKGSVEQARKGQLAEVVTKEDGTQHEWVDPQDVKDGDAALWGATFTILGTIIWGFGDLVLHFVSNVFQI